MEHHKPFINYIREAFLLPANLGFLGIGVAATGAVLMARMLGIAGMDWLHWQVPAFLFSGLELLYLSFMPTLPSFKRAVNAKLGPATQGLSAQMRSLQLLTTLNEASMARFVQFLDTKHKIQENLAKHADRTAGFFVGEQLTKMDSMEAFYVELLAEKQRYSEHVNSGPTTELDQDFLRLQQEVQGATGQVKAMQQKRLDLLEKRRAKNKDVLEQLQVAQIQLDTIDDTQRYLLEQSFTLNHPEEISRLIDSVIHNAEVHHQTARELDMLLMNGNDFPDAFNDGATSTPVSNR